MGQFTPELMCDIGQAYNLTTTHADAQEIVQPMRKLCLVDFH